LGGTHSRGTETRDNTPRTSRRGQVIPCPRDPCDERAPRRKPGRLTLARCRSQPLSKHQRTLRYLGTWTITLALHAIATILFDETCGMHIGNLDPKDFF